MYCKECGQQLDSSATFCKFCGTYQDASNANQETSTARIEENIRNDDTSYEEISIEEQTKLIKKHKVFYSDDEVLIDTLGSGFLSSLFVHRSLKKSVLICSNKRIYQKGKVFEKKAQRIIYNQGEKSVDLREVTGILYYIDSPVYRLIPIIILLLIGTIPFSIGQELGYNLEEGLIIIASFIIGSSIIALIIFSLKKDKWLEIQFAGGSIMTKCHWYPKKNIRKFMRNVSLQKDQIIQLENNQRNSGRL